MNTDILLRKLMSAARQPGKDWSVPDAFEKRVLASLRQGRIRPAFPAVDWAAGLWRVSVSCVALAAVLGACCLSFPGAALGGEDLGVALEAVLWSGAEEALEVL